MRASEREGRGSALSPAGGCCCASALPPPPAQFGRPPTLSRAPPGRRPFPTRRPPHPTPRQLVYALDEGVRRAGGRQGAGAGGDERTTGRGASASARARDRASAHERFSRCLAPPGRRPDPPSPSLSPGFRCPRTRAHLLARLSVELRLWAWGKGRGKGTGVRGCQSNRAAALCVCVHPAPPARPAPRHTAARPGAWSHPPPCHQGELGQTRKGHAPQVQRRQQDEGGELAGRRRGRARREGPHSAGGAGWRRDFFFWCAGRRGRV